MAGVSVNSSPIGRPWRQTGTDMRPNFLLMCKMLLALLLLHRFAGGLQEPFLPFVSGLDLLRSESGWFTLLLRAVFFTAGCCLIFNYRVRWAAIVLGLVVIVNLLASKTLFRNHVFIVGCLFLLAGLHRKDDDPWMLRWQMVIIYAGAFLNKILQSDWRTGQFMHHWLHHELENPYCEALRPHLPELGFAVIISWLVMLSELLLAALFLVRRWNDAAVVAAIAMHVAFFIVVGRSIFGHFAEDVLLAMLIFLSWPAGVMTVAFRPSVQRLTEKVRACGNWDRQFAFGAPLLNPENWIELRMEDRSLENAAAGWCFLKYNSAFYFTAFVVFNGTAYLISHG
jgi:hypothetical protein